MRVLSVCSGIGAAELAFTRCGMSMVASSEIDPFPSAVLAHHWPETPNWGDMTKFEEWPDADVDVLVGGTPCQSFSVAGLRKGLADPRGNLALTYLAIADRYRPEWLVWENVPGVLSSSGGRDFGAFLGGLGQLGYGFAYRVLDAQHFGVAQRRRRVFVVGHLGDWRRAAAVLFERESLSGHPAPRREAGEVAPTIPARRTGGGGLGTDFDCDGGLIKWPADVASTLNAHYGDKWGLEDQHINQGAPLHVPVAYDMRGREGGAQMEGPHETANIRASSGGSSRSYVIQERAVAENPDAGPDGAGFREGAACTLEARTQVQVQAVAFHENQRGEVTTSETAGSLKTGGGKPGQGYPAVAHALRAGGFDASEDGTGRGTSLVPTPAMQVRRLTPTECERLQGFPDGWTDIPWRNGSAKDGPRYKALGNSMAVPVMEWIGRRIVMVDALAKELEAA